jgi:hypothetical protein
LRFKSFEGFKQDESFTAKGAKDAQKDAEKTSTVRTLTGINEMSSSERPVLQ